MIAEPWVRTLIRPVPVRERVLRLVKPRPQRNDLKLRCLVALLEHEVARLNTEEKEKTYLSDLRVGDRAYLSSAAIEQEVDSGKYHLCLEARPAFLERGGYPIEVRRREDGYLLRVPQGMCIMSSDVPFRGRARSMTVAPYRMGAWCAGSSRKD